MVMMSGGVDSSVAAAVLRDEGHDVTGVTLKLWGGESDSGCCSAADVEDARRVAAQLGIPHYVFNFTDEFDANVVAPYVESYAAGETPNPCVECNRTMKFGRVHRARRAARLRRGRDRSSRARRRHAATGARSRVASIPPRTSRTCSTCSGRSEIARTRLPIGEMTKAEVRARAHALGLRTAAKRESMDVCFITRGGRSAFLGDRIGRRPGVIVDTAGAEVGAHDGVDRFTIGQRRGTGVAEGERRYVVDIAPDTGHGHRRSARRAAARSRAAPRRRRSRATPPAEVLAQIARARRAVRGRASTATRCCSTTPQPRVAPGPGRRAATTATSCSAAGSPR